MAPFSTIAFWGWMLICIPSISWVYCQDSDKLPDDVYLRKGDVYIGVLQIVKGFNHDKFCSDDFSEWKHFQRVPSSIFALDAVNKDPNILQNITLGLIQLDHCNKPVTGVGQALKFFSRPDEGFKANFPNETLKVVGVVGALSSVASMAVCNIFNLYKTPFISSTSSSDELSDRSTYPYFYRVCPPDSFQAKVMVDILEYFNWSYVAVVHEENSYGFNSLTFLRRLTREKGICISDAYPLSDSFIEEDYEKLVRKLGRNNAGSPAKAVIVIAFSYKMRALFLAAHKLGQMGEWQWILSTTAHMGVFSGIEEIAHGALISKWYNDDNVALFKYIEDYRPAVDPENPWLRQIWKKKFNCSGETMTTDSRCLALRLADLPEFYVHPIVIQLTQAISAMAQAIDLIIDDKCPAARQNKQLLDTCFEPSDILDYLARINIETPSGNLTFTESGEVIKDYQILQLQRRPNGGRYDLIDVGMWKQTEGAIYIEATKLQWSKTKGVDSESEETEAVVPQSVCAKPCKSNEFYIMGELPCCWDCHSCRDNEYVADNATTCRACDEFLWPNNVSFTHCVPIAQSFMTFTDTYGVGLLTLAATGLAGTLLITCLVVRHRNRKIIKGASWQMVTVILAGLMLAFSIVPVFLTTPTTIVCLANRLGFSLSCTFIFGPLLVKTNRVYQVFRAASKMSRSVRMAKNSIQVGLTCVIILIQVGLCAVSNVFWPITSRLSMPVKSEKYVELHCYQDQTGLLIPLSFNIFLILVCAVFAFLTRKLPDNFNESWYIFLCGSATLFMWVAFLPTYYTAFYAFHKEALLALALIINGFTLVVCLFAPKVYALYFVDEKDIKISDFSTGSFEANEST